MENIKLYIIDNSVILKAFLNESGSDKVKKLLVRKKRFEISIFVPDIFRYEFFNKLTKEYNEVEAMKAFKIFIDRQVSIIPLEEDLIKLANKLVTKYPKISFYDAVYHALAQAYKADLITADEHYYEMTKKEGHVKLLDQLEI